MKNLLSLLSKIQIHSQLLLDCLNLEKQALDTNTLDGLNDIAEKKTILFKELESLNKQRKENSSDKDFNQYLLNTKDQKLINQWSICEKIISACKKQNEINGRIINRYSQSNQDVLSIITGRKQSKDDTYNSQGNQTRNTSLLNDIKA